MLHAYHHDHNLVPPSQRPGPEMASPPMKGGPSRRSLVQMDSIACMDGKGGAVGKQIMAAAPETPVKPLEPLVASPPSHTKKNAYLDFGKDDDVREASVKTLPGTSLFLFPPFSHLALPSVWRSGSLDNSLYAMSAAHLETDADKAARLERRRIAEERMAEVEAARRAHMTLLIKELVHEVFVDGVSAKFFPGPSFLARNCTSSPHHHAKTLLGRTGALQVVERWRILDMARRSEASARQFAADAVCFRMMGGYTETDDQDEVAGLPLKDWRRDNVPETRELEALKIKQAEHGTWMDRARKNVRNKFEGGTKEVCFLTTCQDDAFSRCCAVKTGHLISRWRHPS